MIPVNVSDLAQFWGVPVAITGLFFGLFSWFIKYLLTKQAKKQEEADKAKEQRAIEREKQREKLMLMLMQNTRAVTVLSEATARAVQRIPDAKCNGDMTRAIEYVTKVQNEQKDFLMGLGIHSIYE